MRIVNPTFGIAAGGGESVAVQPIDWRVDPIVLFSNSKPNARELLEGVKAKLGRTDDVAFVYKNSASQPAPAALIEEVAAKYKGALLAIAD